MTHNNRIQDDDLRLLTAISDKFKQAITAGETTSIETVLVEMRVQPCLGIGRLFGCTRL